MIGWTAGRYHGCEAIGLGIPGKLGFAALSANLPIVSPITVATARYILLFRHRSTQGCEGFRRLHLHGEPHQFAPEVPQRMEGMCLRAVSENIISESRAAELLNTLLDQSPIVRTARRNMFGGGSSGCWSQHVC